MTSTEPLSETQQHPAAPPRTTPSPATPSRGSMIWRRKWWVVLFALVVGGATYGVTSQLDPRYEASATVQVALLGGNATSEGVTAANDLASQYAQIIDSDPVVEPVARKLHLSADEVRDNVEGATVNEQNLISVSAKAGSGAEASEIATTTARTLVRYVTKSVASQATSVNEEALAQLKPLDDQIRSLRKKMAGASKKEQESQQFLANQQSLATLEAQRAATIGDIARTGVSGRPSLQVLNPAGTGKKVSPKPVLYAIAAFVIALLLAAQASSLGRRPS
jgi:uncharacterized protein involved in exopolysaccharide biosynthesis